MNPTRLPGLVNELVAVAVVMITAVVVIAEVTVVMASVAASIGELSSNYVWQKKNIPGNRPKYPY